MKTLIALLLFSLVQSALAQEVEEAPAPEPLLAVIPSTDRLPGVDLAQGITEITGTAVSPLLGVSAVGAWKYFHTPEARRNDLPWFCQPTVWGIGFAILALCFLKDSLGTMAPPLIKKPLDMVELFESKLSALVASAAFVPLIAAEMARHAPVPDQAMLSLPSGEGFLSMAVIGLDFRFLLVPICLLSFGVVWITSHAINVLITLCPFGVVDAMLKLAKGALISLIVISYSFSPYVGAFISVTIIAIAAMLAPWAFRLTVFGTVFATDTILPSRAGRRATPEEPHGFTARVLSGVPARTLGRVVRGADGTMEFRYRPWLVLPQRTTVIKSDKMTVSRGMFYPSLSTFDDTSGAHTKLILFLPRYRSHEEFIARHFAIHDVRDSTLIKGCKAVRNWFAEVFSLGRKPQAGATAS